MTVGSDALEVNRSDTSVTRLITDRLPAPHIYHADVPPELGAIARRAVSLWITTGTRAARPMRTQSGSASARSGMALGA